jgi:hypothetical protein
MKKRRGRLATGVPGTTESQWRHHAAAGRVPTCYYASAFSAAA